MANTKTKKKKTNKTRIVAVILSVILFFIAGGVLGWFASAQNWFGMGKAPVAVAEGGSGLIVPEKTEGKGIRLLSTLIEKEDYAAYGIDAQADSAVTITATVEPADAENQALTWTVRFKNASSAWATGKNVASYMTVANASNTKTATVSCLKAFGEQIEIVVASVENPSITAVSTCDYVKRLTGATVTLNNGSTNTNTIVVGDGKTYKPVMTPTYSDGTIAVTASIKSAKLSLGESFVDYMNEEAYTHFNPGCGMTLTYNGDFITITNGLKSNSDLPRSLIREYNVQDDRIDADALYNNLFKYTVEKQNQEVFTYLAFIVEISVKRGSTEIETREVVDYPKFDASLMTMKVTGVTVNNSTLEF